MKILGIDPDLHRTAFAIINENKKVVSVAVSKVPHSLKGSEAVMAQINECKTTIARISTINCPAEYDAIVVEGQETYFGAGHAPPQGIVYLGQMTGVLLGLCFHRCQRLSCPKPKSWKGQVPKDIHHKRIQTKVDASETQVHGAIADKDWIHIWDAIGLALYGLEKING